MTEEYTIATGLDILNDVSSLQNSLLMVPNSNRDLKEQCNGYLH